MRSPKQSTDSSPSKQDPYYFQIILKRLSYQGPSQSRLNSLYFTVAKGRQIFEFTKPITLEWNNNSALLFDHKLNFALLHYQKGKLDEFALRMNQPSSDEDQHIAEYLIDCNNFVEHFEDHKYGSFEQTCKMGQSYTLQTQIYVQKKRYDLQKLARQTHNPKPNAPKTVLHMINQRPPEVKQKQKAHTKITRIKRTPSPLRRRKSPIRNDIKEKSEFSKTVSDGRSDTAGKELCFKGDNSTKYHVQISPDPYSPHRTTPLNTREQPSLIDSSLSIGTGPTTINLKLLIPILLVVLFIFMVSFWPEEKAKRPRRKKQPKK